MNPFLWTLAVSQTVSQNKAFDLVCFFAKLLIRLKVRTEMVPVQGIEPPHPAPVSSFEVQDSRFKSMDSLNLRLRTKRTVDKDVYKVTGLFVLPKWHFLLHTECTIGS